YEDQGKTMDYFSLFFSFFLFFSLSFSFFLFFSLFFFFFCFFFFSFCSRFFCYGSGDPFVMHAGDCVLQPPEIRHRVLEWYFSFLFLFSLPLSLFSFF